MDNFTMFTQKLTMVYRATIDFFSEVIYEQLRSIVWVDIPQFEEIHLVSDIKGGT
jgi:hypothetical protein